MQKFINVIVLLAILLFPVTADAELPFTVHTIYFQPTDALAPTDRITELMKEVQKSLQVRDESVRLQVENLPTWNRQAGPCRRSYSQR